MFTPAPFKKTDLGDLYQFIQDYPLGTLITSSEDIINADHIPFYLNQVNDEQVTLQSHIAKANPLWKKCDDGQEILLIFHGPNAYISPNFYPSKKLTGKAVPTWNYSVVHVRGRIHFKHDATWLMQLLDNLSNFHELSQPTPWSVSDAPEAYTKKLVQAVVGLEISVTDIVGQFKLSQNKTTADYSGVVAGLAASGDSADTAVAEQMKAIQHK
jgi:transcriptional regulator